MASPSQPSGNGSHLIRDHEDLHQRDDESGLPLIDKLQGTSVALTTEGTIRDATIFTYLHCGHPSTNGVGGKCTVPGCMNVSCKACYEGARCHSCFAGCCLEHKHEIACSDGVVRVVCPRCKDRLRRERRTQAITRFLLAPFVDFKDR